MFENDLFIQKIGLQEDIAPSKFDSYPLNINALRGFVSMKITSPVLIFNGENGCGKSTIIEALATNLGIPVNGGSSNLSAIIDSAVTINQEESKLAPYLYVSKSYKKPYRTFFFRAESFHEISSVLDKDEWIIKSNYSSKKLLGQSHGESFMDLIEHQFIGNSLYILDEPESALSPQNQLKLLCIIDNLVKKGTQFIIATHSPIILGYKNAKIVNLDDGMRYIDYKETNIYHLYKRFIDDPISFQNMLFDGEEE